MESLEEIKSKFNSVGYFVGEEAAQAIRVALVLEKPLLIEGPPGVGKTSVAHALAEIFDEDLLRVQCYEGIGVDQLLYEYNYTKQLLMISMIKDRIHKKIAQQSIKKAIQTLDKEDVFWGEHFLIKRPVLQSLVSKHNKKRVLLIDEIDKTEKSTEALLLEVLSEYTISIPEYGTIKANLKPIVVLTSNQNRYISDTLRRRCAYLYLDYPDKEAEKNIVKLHVPEADEKYIQRVVEAIQKIRKLPLKQIPAIAETIEVIKLVQKFSSDDLGWLSLVAKHNEDKNIILKSGIKL